MNPGAASLIDALVGTLAKPAGQKMANGVEGLFSALVGETETALTAPELNVETPGHDGIMLSAAAILETGQVSSPDQLLSPEQIISLDQDTGALETAVESDITDLSGEIGIEAEINPEATTPTLALLQAGREQVVAPTEIKTPQSQGPNAVIPTTPTNTSPQPTIGIPVEAQTGNPASGTTTGDVAANPQNQVALGALADRFAGTKPVAGQKAKTETNSEKSSGQTNTEISRPATKSTTFSALVASQTVNQVDPSSGAKPASIESLLVEPLTPQTGSIENPNTLAAIRGQLPQAASPVASLAVQIATRAMEGARRFEIRMDPPELGRIDVHLKIDDQGVVSTRLMVERPETLELLQRDARALERALGEAGLKTEEGGVRMSLKNGNGNQNAFSGTNQDGSSDPAIAQNDKNQSDTQTNGELDIPMNAAMHLNDGMVNIVV